MSRRRAAFGQLALSFEAMAIAPPPPPPPAEPVEEWLIGRVDRTGVSRYIHIARAKGDPERTPRAERVVKDQVAKWLKDLDAAPIEELAATIKAHLADGIPRTFQRLSVELIDKDADTVFESTWDDALWLLVERGDVQFRNESPILFMRNWGAEEACA